MLTEVEIGVMWPQAKEPRNTGSSKEPDGRGRFLPRPPEGAGPGGHLDFIPAIDADVGLPAAEQRECVLLMASQRGPLSQQPQDSQRQDRAQRARRDARMSCTRLRGPARLSIKGLKACGESPPQGSRCGGCSSTAVGPHKTWGCGSRQHSPRNPSPTSGTPQRPTVLHPMSM